MEMNDLSCAQFLAQLASKAPTPGGGGTAALVGAAGVALGNMVGCLTTGKKKYAVVEADIQALNARAEALRLELEALLNPADSVAVQVGQKAQLTIEGMPAPVPATVVRALINPCRPSAIASVAAPMAA